MSYVLESANEFDRLERQSLTEAYDFHQELSHLARPEDAEARRHVLDAGCGSGIVTRHLAKLFPAAQVTGCDLSEDRLARARRESHGFGNVDFEVQNLAALRFPADRFDTIVCRYVLQHLSPEVRSAALRELARCLRPGGELTAVDMDGAFVGLYPVDDGLQERMRKVFVEGAVDMYVGRKIPSLLRGAGLTDIRWRIEALDFTGALRETELSLNEERFEAAMAYLESVLGGTEAALAFRRDYAAAIRREDAVLFCNKLVVTARKPSR